MWMNCFFFFLSAFVSAAIATCYLFLLVYTWVFFGEKIQLNVPSYGIRLTFLLPFRSLTWVVGFYAICALVSFIVWIVGSALLQLSEFCEATAPMLYNFAAFLVGIYWTAFAITIIYIVKMFCGGSLAKMVKEAARAPTIGEMEEKIFRQKFNDFDKDRENKVSRRDVPNLLKELGLFVPDEELITLIKTLDPGDSGFVQYDDLLQWFRKMNAEVEGADIRSDGDVAEDYEARQLFQQQAGEKRRR